MPNVKAIIRSGVKDTRTLKYTHNADVAAGDVIVGNGQVLVCVTPALANVETVYAFRGKVEFPKEAALAVALGDVCYWVTDTNINKTANGNTKAGICTEAALAADTVVLVELGENK